MSEERTWVALELPDIDVGWVTTVVAGVGRCASRARRTAGRAGQPTATGDLEVGLPTTVERPSLMDQVVDVLTEWGLDAVFGMVGHSNLGLADALRRASEDGRLSYVGIRHEGAAAFAASGYTKLTGRPAACFSIAGPGGDQPAHGALGRQGRPGPCPRADRPGPDPGSWAPARSRRCRSTRPSLPGRDDPPPKPMHGRIAAPDIAPPEPELGRAIELLASAERPVVVCGNGAHPFRDADIALAEHLDAPIITTFKAKGLVGDDHPLACGTVGRSGIPVASQTMARSDCLLVLGASFSNHTSIATYVPTIQVDLDRMALGRFHPVEVPLWGDIGRTLGLLHDRLPPVARPAQREVVAQRWARWRAEKANRELLTDGKGRLHPALTFRVLSELTPSDAVLAVDVGNNTYSFGHFFESRGRQYVLMSGYLGSIGFALPAAIGASVALRRAASTRKVVSISGDGGLGQYLAEVTTAVKYALPLTHVVLDNGELAKISREQLGAVRPVWETQLVNPDFAAYARDCGAAAFTVATADELRPALEEALAVTDRPSLVHGHSSNRDV